MIFERGILDFLKSCSQFRAWFYLGVLDLKQRYRGSTLGPWWISLSMLIFTLAMTQVYGRLFGEKIGEYTLFFASGYLAWQFISGMILESVELFKGHKSYLMQKPHPLSIFILRLLTKQLLIFAHNLCVFVLLAIYFGSKMNLLILLLIPSMTLLSLNLYWIALVFALFGARFKDMLPILTNCIQVAFFITPVTWMPKLLGQDSIILALNPLTYLIELVRNPLLGEGILLSTWSVVALMTLIGFMATFFLISRFKHRVIFWIA